MARADLNIIEFYEGWSDKLITTVRSAVVPRERQNVCIGEKLYMVAEVDNVIDYEKFECREMRVCISLQESRMVVPDDAARSPKGEKDLFHIRWNK